jgi:hypothetical protein
MRIPPQGLAVAGVAIRGSRTNPKNGRLRREGVYPVNQRQGYLDAILRERVFVPAVESRDTDDHIVYPYHIEMRITDIEHPTILEADPKRPEGPFVQPVVKLNRS